MKTHVYSRKLLVPLALILSVCVISAQQATKSSDGAALLTQPMPVDPQITMGQFKNGLRYYIRTTKKPEKRAELRLVVKAGSILEDDDQLGLAHFVEHMAFNGTKNFPKQELQAFIESLGMRFGAHLNAYTSFDETVYFLPIPSDSPEKLEKGFQILEDWAFNANLTPEEIDKERGVVLEEWRGRLGANERMLQPQMRALFGGSKYTDRNPIGTPENLKSFPHQRLRDFYRDFYRPDRMAFVVVGDIDPVEVEAQIRTHFGALKAASTGARQPAPIPPTPK